MHGRVAAFPFEQLLAVRPGRIFNPREREVT